MIYSTKPGRPQVAAIILAAGASTRFGQCKQLIDWRGKPLIAHVADVALEAELDPVIVVLGCQMDDTYAALGGRRVQKLVNWRWEKGQSTSVRTGLAAVPPQAQGALFLQCDQPLVSPDLLNTLVDRFRESEDSIIYPVHGSHRGTPVLFPRRFFSELASVTGDKGGRGLLKRHAEEAATVTVNDPDELSDIDTPADYELLRQLDAQTRGRSPASILRHLQHVVIDMDGVLWRGDQPLPGLEGFFEFLRRQDITFTLATNNASLTPDEYARKLAGFGVDVPLPTILTSALVVASYLADVAPPASSVFMIGEDGLQQALESEGFAIQNEDVDYVVIGWDRKISYQKLTTAALLIHRGAEFIGTNPDVTYPTERGPAVGNGAILAAVEAATGVSPIITGKPEPQMYEEALRRMGATTEATAMIGDRIETDIAGAARVGLTTVLTLSGISTADDVASSSIRPDVICDNIASLTALWEDALATA